MKFGNHEIKKGFVTTGYICNCGHKIEIDAYNGQCPICGEDSPEKRKLDKICPVCKNKTLVDKHGNGECEHCGWIQNNMNLEFPDRVVCPNLISLNKARNLYKKGKPFIPDFDDFIDGYNFYGEMEFTYNDIIYGVMGAENVGVEFWGANTNKYEIFKDIEEFKLKARIDGKLLKDIWHDVKNANWLQ